MGKQHRNRTWKNVFKTRNKNKSINSKNKKLNEQRSLDKNEEKINKVLSYVTNAQIGDSTDESFIDSLGVSNFDLCVVAIGDDFQQLQPLFEKYDYHIITEKDKSTEKLTEKYGDKIMYLPYGTRQKLFRYIIKKSSNNILIGRI